MLSQWTMSGAGLPGRLSELGLFTFSMSYRFYILATPLQAAGLGHFVVKIKQGPKSTVASLLVKYKTDSVTLRVVNNCSEFSLHCRSHIYVPGRVETC